MATCAFCGRERTLSKEHVFPDWLLSEFPLGDGRRVRRSADIRSASDINVSHRDEGPLNVASEVRIVCRSEHQGDDGCNDGWMSRLEAKVKPLIIELARAQPRDISADEQRLLAYWTTKPMIVCEYGGGAGRITTAEQRHLLYEHRDDCALLFPTTVYIGTLAEPLPERLNYFRRCMVGDSVTSAPTPMGEPEFILGQQTTFAIERLMLSVITSVMPGKQLTIESFLQVVEMRNEVRRLDLRAGTLAFPATDPLTADRLMLFTHALTPITGAIAILPEELSVRPMHD